MKMLKKLLKPRQVDKIWYLKRITLEAGFYINNTFHLGVELYSNIAFCELLNIEIHFGFFGFTFGVDKKFDLK